MEFQKVNFHNTLYINPGIETEFNVTLNDTETERQTIAKWRTLDLMFYTM